MRRPPRASHDRQAFKRARRTGRAYAGLGVVFLSSIGRVVPSDNWTLVVRSAVTRLGLRDPEIILERMDRTAVASAPIRVPASLPRRFLSRCPHCPPKRPIAALPRNDAKGHERPKCSVAKDTYSITSSAMANKVDGTVRSRAFAVVKLISRSNFVGCSTGISAGAAPRSTLSTSSAVRRNCAGQFMP
jgi:hypothetical protein